MSKITAEFSTLTETKDIIDELDMIMQLMKDQSSISGAWRNDANKGGLNPGEAYGVWSLQMLNLLHEIAYAEDIRLIKELALKTQVSVSASTKNAFSPNYLSYCVACVKTSNTDNNDPWIAARAIGT